MPNERQHVPEIPDIRRRKDQLTFVFQDAVKLTQQRQRIKDVFDHFEAGDALESYVRLSSVIHLAKAIPARGLFAPGYGPS